MIPILYSAEETEFTTNGLGFLSDVISATVTEERNGIYEAEFSYPITGAKYDEIQEGMIIGVSHDEVGDIQPFRIYRRSAQINGIVTFNARHIAYELQNVIVAPFSANNVASALAGFSSNALTSNPFTFWTDKSTNGTFAIDVPSSVWEKLKGSAGSILDVYGTGEWEYDKYTCKLHLHRGNDNDVTIRYGKNLIDIENIVEDDGTYNAVIPFWQDPTTLATVIGDLSIGSTPAFRTTFWTNQYGTIIRTEGDEPIEFPYIKIKVAPLNLTDQFQTQPTKTQLDTAAVSYLDTYKPWIPKQNITVDFVALWQTEEYKNYALLQRVKLCDTVSIIYPELGVDAKAEVIRVVWNVLLERYDEIEIGEARATYAGLISQQASDEALSQIVEDQTDIDAAIQHATDLITGALGGHVVMVMDANDKPTEILVMDTEDVSTAVNVLRINVNGIGFSHNGVNGPYSTAWTLDGNFVADFITTGTLNGTNLTVINLTATNVNLSGIFKAAIDANNYLELDSGSLELYANGGKTVTIEHAYENGSIIGGKICLYDSNGVDRIDIEALRSNNQATLYLRQFDRTPGVMIQDNGFWLGPNAGYFQNNNNYAVVIGRLNSGAGNGAIILRSVSNEEYGAYMYVDSTDQYGYLRLYSGGDHQHNYYAVFSMNGLWFHSGSAYNIMLTTDNGIYTAGDLLVDGSKNRRVKTKSYGNRVLYATEGAEPFFTDMGENEIGKDGTCEVPIDPIFAETVDLDGYQVFLTKYGRGDLWVEERLTDHFVVGGDPGLRFGWEIKAHQFDHNGKRLEESYIEEIDGETKGKKRGSKGWTVPPDDPDIRK